MDKLDSRLPETVESVPFGTKRGLVECEYQFRCFILYSLLSSNIIISLYIIHILLYMIYFRNELWNCSDNRDSRRIQQTIERGETAGS